MNWEKKKRKEIGSRIKAARENKRLTKVELAEHLGVSRETLFRWESGEHDVPATKLFLLSKWLDVGVEHLVGEP